MVANGKGQGVVEFLITLAICVNQACRDRPHSAAVCCIFSKGRKLRRCSRLFLGMCCELDDGANNHSQFKFMGHYQVSGSYRALVDPFR